MSSDALPASSATNILIVEDDPFLASALDAVLSAAGYEVRVVHDGRQALDAITAEVPDLLITDLMMPEMDGNALIQAVRATHPDLPIVVLTGRPPPRGLADLAGEDPSRMALLTKPVVPAELFRSIQSVLVH